MTHRFPIKEIARQAGLGTATVDRVLNDRAYVSPQTRNRVRAAIEELEGQERQLSSRGRRMFVDLVIEAPRRFSNEVRRAAEATLGNIGVGVFRPRFQVQETMADSDVIATLDRIAKRGSQGVCLKARDVPAINAKVDQLEAAGIPVVTLVTDLPGSQRSAYVGLDNANAGRSAAYLLATTVTARGATVLTNRSQDDFFGEIERFSQFRDTLAARRPDLKIVDISGGAGLPGATAERLGPVLQAHPDPAAIYSMGGGNAAILNALPKARRGKTVFVAHDLDAENLGLLRDGLISFVLHHDLEIDMRNMFLAIAARHGLTPPGETRLTSDIQIVTPFNIPASMAGTMPRRP